MFEEVPRPQRGLAGLSARHVVLGPFMIGGVLLAVGGSVAFAATVITSSTTRTNDLPPPRHPVVVASGSGHRSAAAQHQAMPTANSTAPAGAQPSAVPMTSAGSSSRSPAVTSASSAESSTAPAVSTAAPSGTSSTSGPVGNALIYVDGYNSANQRLQFRYADVSPGAGPGGSDVYRVGSGHEYSAVLAGDVTITSAGQLCPPAGNRCSTDQLAAAAGTGFFAIAAIDPADQLHSIVEVDNATSFAPAAATPSAQPSTAQPSASPTGS
ncbi:MAG: hypothetical protein ACJ74U_18365 [Jatrophihabitantaceae bacterium]